MIHILIVIIYTRVGWYLPNWHRTMPTVKHHDGRWHRGAGLGACPKRESVCRKARKTNNVFYGATKAVLNSSLRAPPLCIFCMSLFVNTPDSDNQLVRSELRAWTLFRLTWSVVDKCNLEQISCLLKLLHGPYTVSIAPYSLSRGNLLKFTSLQDIHSRKCAAKCLHTHWRNLLEKREVWHNIPL